MGFPVKFEQCSFDWSIEILVLALSKVCDCVQTLHLIHFMKLLFVERPVLRRPRSPYDMAKV